MIKNVKPTVSLSLGIDKQWAYLGTHGDVGWESLPSYLDILIPRVAHLLDDASEPVRRFLWDQPHLLDHQRDRCVRWGLRHGSNPGRRSSATNFHE